MSFGRYRYVKLPLTPKTLYDLPENAQSFRSILSNGGQKLLESLPKLELTKLPEDMGFSRSRLPRRTVEWKSRGEPAIGSDGPTQTIALTPRVNVGPPRPHVGFKRPGLKIDIPYPPKQDESLHL